MKKLVIPFAMLATVTVFAWIMGGAREPASGFRVEPGIAVLTNIQPTLVQLQRHGTNTGSVVLLLTNSTATTGESNAAPGVYTARPYSLIVVIPRPTDEQSVVGANNPAPEMPVVKPDTRLEKR